MILFADFISIPIVDDKREFKLLFFEYEKLILEYQSMIKRVVTYYCKSYNIKVEDQEDIIQDINEFLLKKKSTFQSNYKGFANPKGFFYKVIENECSRLVKKYVRIKFQPLFSKPILINAEHPEHIYFIKEEISRLGCILSMFQKQRLVLELCIKISFEIPLSENDIRNCFIGLPENILIDIIGNSKQFTCIPEYKVHLYLKKFFDIVEGKKLQAQSRIRRTHNYKTEIKKQLEFGGRGRYDNESLRFLFELYFAGS